MIKRTLYFGNPAYLKTRNEQIVVLPVDGGEEKTVPIEDTGIVILDHQQVTISQALMAKLLDNNVALITCDSSHLPVGLFLPLSGHTLQASRFRAQIDASEPLKKQLWQQTIQAKIENQAAMLDRHNIPSKNMKLWAKEVRSGDPDNYEARAAAYYWKNIFGANSLPVYREARDEADSFSLEEGQGEASVFTRDRFGEPPNNLLNYSYAILRAVTARSLVGSGMLPTFGIHHRNQYNAYCLADDIMEPYRPFADKLVKEIVINQTPLFKLDTALKKQLLVLPTIDVEIDGQRSPLMVAMQRTTASLIACFEKKARQISYPIFPIEI